MNENFLNAVKKLVLDAQKVLSAVEECEQPHPHDEFELSTSIQRVLMILEWIEEGE